MRISDWSSDVCSSDLACAWLIRRFIDPQARFKFVDSRHYQPGEGELRFDMADAEFTHEGDRCSFETLLLRADLLDDPALVAIGEIGRASCRERVCQDV